MIPTITDNIDAERFVLMKDLQESIAELKKYNKISFEYLVKNLKSKNFTTVTEFFLLLEEVAEREDIKLDIDMDEHISFVLDTVISNDRKTEEIEKREMLNDIGKGSSADIILKKAMQRGLQEKEAEKILDKLKRAGDVFEPKRGIIKKI
ncbi:hypothetical protein J4410_05820 [Candidatus Woesearchaeota archaeon]|nr:hypothetical protein [Candidatus Woesearchaeota archaeon]